MESYKELTDQEIVNLFNTSYFLETRSSFIRCDTNSRRTIEVVSKKVMYYLKKRLIEIEGKERSPRLLD